MDKYLQYLESQIDKKKLGHSIATAKQAVELARIYGEDEQKAYIAGLLHDVAKGKCRKGLKNIAQQYSVDIDEFENINPELIHGKLGAKMVEKELGIDDEDILNAICWHTTGRENMSMLEKIVYIADLTEPGRDFENIEKLRVLAGNDIDSAMIMSLKGVMEFVKSRGFTLHPNSEKAYEQLKRRKKENLDYSKEALNIAKQLFMKKAEDVRLLKVDHLTIVADYFLLASGRSDVHVKSLSDEAEELMEKAGKQRLRIEGYRQGRWIVLDYGDIIIHIFHKSEREFYDLERLWLDGDNCINITDDMIVK